MPTNMTNIIETTAFYFKFWKKRLLTDLDGLGDLDRDLDLALAVKLLL